MTAYTPGIPTTTNIVIGPADIYYDDTVDVYLGSTIGETKIETKREYDPLEVEQVIGPIGQVLKNETCTITGTLAEATLANLEKVLGNGSTAGFGSNSGVAGHSWQIKTNGPAGTTRTFTIHKGVISTGTSISLKKGEVSGVPFEMICYKDTSQTDGVQFFTVADA